MGECRSLKVVSIFLIAGICAGCGGTASSIGPPPPPPAAADFTLTVSSASLSISQGDVGPSVTFSVTPHNSFNASVQITFTNLPAGVTSNPASPFTAEPGTNTAVVFGAATSAGTGSFIVSAEGVSGALSHSATLTLAILASNLPALPRTTFIRTDAVAGADNPAGEPHHRHLVYDPAHKNIFIANHAMNRLDVVSAVDQSGVAQIAISGITSVDLSADGVTVWTGTSLNEVVAVDAASLKVKRIYMQPGVRPLPVTVFDRPVEVLSLANEKCFLRLRQSGSSEALLALWDPVSDALTNLTSTAPQLFQSGLGAIARSGDQTKVIVASNDSSGEIAIFDSNGALIAGPHSLGTGSITWVAANTAASRFAAAFTANGTAQVLLLDASLNQVASYNSGVTHALAFSRNGNFLYAAESFLGAPVITILDGHDAHVIGQVPDIAIQGITSQIEDADETQLLFALSNRGVSFVDAKNPVALSGMVPEFAAAPPSTPSEGPNSGGTTLILSGQNFPPDALVKIGAQLATNVSVASPTGMQATSPASVATGAVNITAYSAASNWLALAPDAFTYGAQIFRVLPNAGVSSGGDTIQIYGYGFGSDVSGITVKIGGTNAIVQSVDNLPGFASALGLGSSYPFSLERITLQTPPGLPGISDVVITTSSGSATPAKAFQYLQSAQSYSKPGFYRFLTYDQKRQRVYLSNIDHVDVFDLQAGAFVAPLQPPGGPPPNAGLKGLAMTPGGSQLVIADFGAQTVYVVDPATGSGTSTVVGGVPGFASSGPSRVAATSTQTVFVGLSGEGGFGLGCSSCLTQMNLSVSPPLVQPVPQPEVSSIVGAPMLQGNAAGDHVFLAFGNNSVAQFAIWNAASPNQFNVSQAGAPVKDLAPAADGNIFASQTNATTEIRNSGMLITAVPASAELTQIPGRNAVPGVAVHPSGALIYQPFLTGPAGTAGVKGGVDIVDAHSGALRLRIFLPQQFMTDVDALHGDFLTIDENGQRLFAITSLDGSPQQASLTVVQFAAVPLGIGSVLPVIVPIAGGTSITIRGSGFLAGIKVTIGGKPATATMVDMNTIKVVSPVVSAGPQQLTITNASGEAVSLDAALAAN